MSSSTAEASDLVMTQAELPPGIDVPSPDMGRKENLGRKENDRAEGKPENVSTELLHEIRDLARRVGGLEALRDIVIALSEMTH